MFWNINGRLLVPQHYSCTVAPPNLHCHCLLLTFFSSTKEVMSSLLSVFLSAGPWAVEGWGMTQEIMFAACLNADAFGQRETKISKCHQKRKTLTNEDPSMWLWRWLDKNIFVQQNFFFCFFLPLLISKPLYICLVTLESPQVRPLSCESLANTWLYLKQMN